MIRYGDRIKIFYSPLSWRWTILRHPRDSKLAGRITALPITGVSAKGGDFVANDPDELIHILWEQVTKDEDIVVNLALAIACPKEQGVRKSKPKRKSPRK